MHATTLGNWLWEAACTIRGPLDAPKFKDYILPPIFLKCLSDVYDDEVDDLAQEFGDRDTAAKLVEQDHELVRYLWGWIARQSVRSGLELDGAIVGYLAEIPSRLSAACAPRCRYSSSQWCTS